MILGLPGLSKKCVHVSIPSRADPLYLCLLEKRLFSLRHTSEIVWHGPYNSDLYFDFSVTDGNLPPISLSLYIYIYTYIYLSCPFPLTRHPNSIRDVDFFWPGCGLRSISQSPRGCHCHITYSHIYIYIYIDLDLTLRFAARSRDAKNITCPTLPF